MNEFALSALPWVMVGIALAILAVSFGSEKRRGEARGAHIAVGASFGLLLGVTLNSCGLWENHLLGLVLGPLWGMALGALYKGEEAPEQDKGSDNGAKKP